MLALSRIVRFAINTPASQSGEGGGPERDPNGFAGSPSLQGLGRHYEFLARCAGELDPQSAYLIDIKEIDRAIREAAIPILQDACDRRPGTQPAEILSELIGPVAAALGGRLQSLRFCPSPYHSVEMTVSDPTTVLLRQRFDFSASHRLHIPSLSPDENRRVFGKCNNPSGHGHNYQVEPCIAAAIDRAGRQSITLSQLERVVEEVIIQRFDHKYLNIDTQEFSVEAGGLNPSVENIARVCYDLLAPALARAAPGAQLRSITVWETDRTSCTYPA